MDHKERIQELAEEISQRDFSLPFEDLNPFDSGRVYEEAFNQYLERG